MRRLRLVAGLLTVLVVVGCGGEDESRTSSTVDPEMFVGTATTVDGEEVDLASLAGHDLVVWFWAPW